MQNQTSSAVSGLAAQNDSAPALDTLRRPEEFIDRHIPGPLVFGTPTAHLAHGAVEVAPADVLDVQPDRQIVDLD